MARLPENPTQAPRPVVYRTRGAGHGMITRLMSPGDLGQALKPFVFLDIFGGDRATRRAMGEMPLHPHSGIATITVITEGHMDFSDPAAGTGRIGYGGVEWMQAGGGVWHGKEMAFGDVEHVSGFQLWIALPPERENAAPVSAYLEAGALPQVGPAHVIVGSYAGASSPIDAQDGLNYLLVTLKPGEEWTYTPAEHAIAWLAVSKGTVLAESPIGRGEMAVFKPGYEPITLVGSGNTDCTFVLGSAVPHPHDLHMGNYSVHTSAEALAKGERRIHDLAQQIRSADNRRTAAGTIPVYR